MEVNHVFEMLISKLTHQLCFHTLQKNSQCHNPSHDQNWMSVVTNKHLERCLKTFQHLFSTQFVLVIIFYKKSLHSKKESSKITFGNHNSLCSSKPQICCIDAVLLKVLVLTSPWLSSLAAINIIRKYCSIHNATNIWHEIFLQKVLKKELKEYDSPQ